MRAIRPLAQFVCIGAALAAYLAPDSMCGSASAQTLALDAPDDGPEVPEENGVADLARLLEEEAAEFSRTAPTLSGEAAARVRALARVRSIGAYLLRSGADRPWNESAPAVAGARLALLVPRIDALAERAAAGRDARDQPLALEDARIAVRLLEAIAATPSDPLRRAMIAPSDQLAREVAVALSSMLAPLEDLARLLEGGPSPDPWPMVVDARDAGAGGVFDRVRVTIRPDDARRNAAALAEPLAVLGVHAIEAVLARGSRPVQDLAALDGAFAALTWLASLEDAGAPYPMPPAAIEAARARLVAALQAIALPPADPVAGTVGLSTEARNALVALETLDFAVPAATAVIALRGQPSVNEAGRKQLSDAAAALLAADFGGTGGEALRARTAQRIADACASMDRLERSLTQDAPRDLRESMRRLERDARIAFRALPEAFAAMTADPLDATDPDSLSALERVRSIESDRDRIVLLQSVIDAIGGSSPAAGRDFAAIAKRIARLLEDPLKREDAQQAFVAIETLYRAAFPFPYEDELKMRTARAVELTDGAAERVIARAAAARTAWGIALGRGEIGGEAAERLDHAARLCRALADLDQMVQPIDRAMGDRLALWGPWSTRRSMIAPATQDPEARAVLTVRSFLTADDRDSYARFVRDLIALETAIPLVRLTAALERKLAPLLPGDPSSLRAALAPLTTPPSTYSYLSGQWDTMSMLHRAMIESEFARRTGNLKYRDALLAYLARIANGLEQTAFGRPAPIRAIPGFETPDPSAGGGEARERRSRAKRDGR